MTKSQDENGETLPEANVARLEPGLHTQKVEVVVIGDVYWDGVVVSSTNVDTRPC